MGDSDTTTPSHSTRSVTDTCALSLKRWRFACFRSVGEGVPCNVYISSVVFFRLPGDGCDTGREKDAPLPVTPVTPHVGTFFVLWARGPVASPAE